MGKGITLFAGLFLLIIGLALLSYRISSIKKGIVTKATVLRIDEKREGDNDKLYRPVFRFINYKNEPMIYKPAFSANDQWYGGETVKIRYTKDHYEDISILTFYRTFGIVLMLLAGAIVCLFITGGEYWVRHFFKTLQKPVPIS